jgi:hypothetical protein
MLGRFIASAHALKPRGVHKNPVPGPSAFDNNSVTSHLTRARAKLHFFSLATKTRNDTDAWAAVGWARSSVRRTTQLRGVRSTNLLWCPRAGCPTESAGREGHAAARREGFGRDMLETLIGLLEGLPDWAVYREVANASPWGAAEAGRSLRARASTHSGRPFERTVTAPDAVRSLTSPLWVYDHPLRANPRWSISQRRATFVEAFY